MDERERSLLENDFGLKMLEKDPSGLIKKILKLLQTTDQNFPQ